jgi:hypothetical protein
LGGEHRRLAGRPGNTGLGQGLPERGKVLVHQTGQGLQHGVRLSPRLSGEAELILRGPTRPRFGGGVETAGQRRTPGGRWRSADGRSWPGAVQGEWGRGGPERRVEAPPGGRKHLRDQSESPGIEVQSCSDHSGFLKRGSRRPRLCPSPRRGPPEERCPALPRAGRGRTVGTGRRGASGCARRCRGYLTDLTELLDPPHP